MDEALDEREALVAARDPLGAGAGRRGAELLVTRIFNKISALGITGKVHSHGASVPRRL